MKMNGKKCLVIHSSKEVIGEIKLFKFYEIRVLYTDRKKRVFIQFA